ncbi:hypothetical protein [Bordetella sp. N]|uniref:hypothetical protein n=1 Tax=Bordetella sp. N TaxID=1746199 RepID=UPI000710081E|nr:hypothetical protein [Bordetella sp. N]ALM84296.1 hypothetical protein ASB57_16135 [Bordetella sp. N]
MALDDATSAAPGRTPSLLAGRSEAGARDSQSSRILAALEGREPQEERQHMPAAGARSRSSRAWWLLLLLLLLVGTGGGAAWWRIQQHNKALEMPQGSVLANGNDGGQVGGAAMANANVNAAGSSAASTPGAATPGGPLAGLSSVSNGASAGDMNKLAAEPAAPAPAAIVDAPGSNRDASVNGRPADEEPPASNPLSVLAGTPAAAPPQQVALADKNKAVEGKSANGKPVARGNNAKAKKKPDGDAALLSALMSYGLPPPTAAAATASLPGTPLSERLQQCRRKPFLESEQCRLQVCAGQWGLAPECPNPQAQSQSPKRP